MKRFLLLILLLAFTVSIIFFSHKSSEGYIVSTSDSAV